VLLKREEKQAGSERERRRNYIREKLLKRERETRRKGRDGERYRVYSRFRLKFGFDSFLTTFEFSRIFEAAETVVSIGLSIKSNRQSS